MDGVARRRFLTQMGLGLGVVTLGGSLTCWASAPAQPPPETVGNADPTIAAVMQRPPFAPTP